MSIYFLPRTRLGKWSMWSSILSFIFLILFFFFALQGEKGGETFFHNPKLAVPISLAGFLNICSFLTGIITIIKNKERAPIVFLSTLVGFLAIIWMLAEIISPH